MIEKKTVRLLHFHCPKSDTWERRINVTWYCQDCKVKECRPLNNLEERECVIKINTNQRLI
jgi:hypothetical protein